MSGELKQKKVKKSKTQAKEKKKGVVELKDEILKPEFLKSLELHFGRVVVACEKTEGMSYWKYYKWYKDDVDFRKDVLRVQEKQLSDVEDILMEKIRDKSEKSVHFYLSRRHPDYKPKQEVDLGNLNRTFNLTLIETNEEKNPKKNKKVGVGNDAN